MIEAVGTVPAYPRPLEGDSGSGSARRGRGGARAPPGGDRGRGPGRARGRLPALGRGEMRAGRSLDALLSAYRVGARVAWRRIAEAGGRAGLEPATLYLLAESIFAYIDVLSAESAEGYALEQSATAGEMERRRRRLVRLLVRDPPAETSSSGRPPPRPAGRSRAASRWSCSPVRGGIPPPLTFRRTPSPRRSASSSAWSCPTPRAPVAARRSSRRSLTAGARGGLGTAVPWPEAGLSFVRARGALELQGAEPGLTAASGRPGRCCWPQIPVWRRSSSPSDWLLWPEWRRAPATVWSGRSRSGSRSRAGSAWLPPVSRFTRRPSATASQQLRERFGPALEDPDSRLWLALALRARAQAAASG